MHHAHKFHRHGGLVYPLGNEKIRVARVVVHTIARPYEVLAIWREHRKGVEQTFIRDAFKSGAIKIDGIELKVVAAL